MEAELWAAIVGFFLPLAIAVIIRQSWDEAAQAVCAFLVCMVAAAGTSYFTGKADFSHFDTENVVRIALIIMSESIVIFKGFWKPLGVAGAIEKATG